MTVAGVADGRRSDELWDKAGADDSDIHQAQDFFEK